jgi:hypothetical protein
MANAYGFSADDAKRIGRAVRVVERLPPQNETGGPTTPEVSRGVRLLLAKHEGSGGWAVNASAVVTIHNGTPGALASASTIVAYNQFLTMPSGTACTTRWVALGHNGFGWYAVASDGNKFTSNGYVAGNIQLLGHGAGGCLQWYDIANCEPAAPDEQSWLF